MPITTGGMVQAGLALNPMAGSLPAQLPSHLGLLIVSTTSVSEPMPRRTTRAGMEQHGAHMNYSEGLSAVL